MNVTLLKIIIALYSFIVTDVGVSQAIKDKALHVITENASSIQAPSSNCPVAPISNIIETPSATSVTPPLTPPPTPVPLTINQEKMQELKIVVLPHYDSFDDSYDPSSITVKKGEYVDIHVFLVNSSNVGISGRPMHIETTDPLGFRRVGGHWGGQPATTTSQDVNGSGYDLGNYPERGITGSYYGIIYDNQTPGTQTFTFSASGVTKILTVNIQ